MTADELEIELKSGRAPVLVDVRSTAEFLDGHIRGAVHAPFPSVVKHVQTALLQKDRLLVLVCEHGPRAQMARTLLKWHGYKKIELLSGHMAQWRLEGRPLQKN